MGGRAGQARHCARVDGGFVADETQRRFTKRRAAALAGLVALGVAALGIVLWLALRGSGDSRAMPERDLLAQPFGETSIWNTPIGRDAMLAPAGFAYDADGTPDHYDQDRVFAHTAGNSYRVVDVYGESADCRAKGPVLDDVAIDDDLTWERGEGNGSVAIIDARDGETVHQMYASTRCDAGGPVFGTNISPPVSIGAELGSDGTGSRHEDPSALGAHGGSGMSTLGGVIRDAEMSAGVIPHAIKLDVDCKRFCARVPADCDDPRGADCGWVWPALHADSYVARNRGCGPYDEAGEAATWEDENGDTHPVAMGSLLTFEDGSTPDLLGITDPHVMAMFDAIYAYGAYIVDDSCQETASPSAESDPAEGASETYPHDFYTMIDALQVVTNNTPDSVGGGGGARPTP